MSLKLVGYFVELPHGKPAGPSLREAVEHAGDASADETRIVHYLRSCPGLMLTSHRVGDIINPAITDIGTPSAYTDGVWRWPEDLAYYVETYHIALPPEFVQHIRSQNYHAPEFSEDELEKLADEFFS